ncbi:unnamed protein product [Caenorhabditis angaria]|uniref:Uncharacterized protein n=1 Tax=Caenorhabditis angaria TaxID=860376 RepID=A0A9P1J020_9PELO|nr:unnamed protein product [Caenorhabditis angaria]
MNKMDQNLYYGVTNRVDFQPKFLTPKTMQRDSNQTSTNQKNSMSMNNLVETAPAHWRRVPQKDIRFHVVIKVKDGGK